MLSRRSILRSVFTLPLAARTARERWLKEHPPTPQDMVINFWPEKSRNYPTGK